METIEIQKSKSKIFWLLLGSIAFVVAAVWMLFTLPSMFHKIVAVLGIGFFGFGIFFFVRELFDNSPSLIINEQGIYDNSSASSIGLIAWKDIDSFGVGEISSRKFILIFVYDPDKYIKKAENSFKKQALKANFKMTGTPLTISTIAMKCTFDKLLDIMVDGLNHYESLQDIFLHEEIEEGKSL